MKTIPQRELRNRISHVLRGVEAGQRMRITAADLVPVGGVRRTFVPKDNVLALLRRAPLDGRFDRDLEPVNPTIDEL
jgi:antitoxin (DNA-binding transcriptional repressor) of toxin-antitoxin stability system